MHNRLYDKALAFRKEHTVEIEDEKEFYKFFTPKNKDKPEIHGGFAMVHWNGSAAVEERIKKDLSVTIRCLPYDEEGKEGTCIFTGEPSKQRALFAKAY